MRYKEGCKWSRVPRNLARHSTLQALSSGRSCTYSRYTYVVLPPDYHPMSVWAEIDPNMGHLALHALQSSQPPLNSGGSEFGSDHTGREEVRDGSRQRGLGCGPLWRRRRASGWMSLRCLNEFCGCGGRSCHACGCDCTSRPTECYWVRLGRCALRWVERILAWVP
jgi:hypothetical protein